MTTMLVATALALSVPTLPVADGVDHPADEVRMTLAHQIREHQDYVEHIRAVWRHRRAQEASAAVPVTTTPTTSTPTYSGSWGPELAAVGFPAEVIPTMEYIIQRESGGDPSAVNSSSGACGLLQLYPCPSGGLDPMVNLQLGFEKYQASGLAPWGM